MVTERDLIVPSLALLDQAPGGKLTTTALRVLLTEVIRPAGHDAAINPRRREPYFDQKVRNLLSVRATLDAEGWATFNRDEHLHALTDAGRAYLEQQRAATIAQPVRDDMERTGTRFENYRRADESPHIVPQEPFDIDPDTIDRATAAHARIQNQLSLWVIGRGLKPLSWSAGQAQFDLAWFDGATLNVAEVKSLTVMNEVRQLRLGLGQVLHYQSALRSASADVVAVLAVERQPTDPAWLGLCAAHGVRLAWPATFDSLAESDGRRRRRGAALSSW